MEKRKHRFLGRITSVLLAFTVVFGMCGMVFPEEASAASSLKSPQNVIVKAGKTTAGCLPDTGGRRLRLMRASGCVPRIRQVNENRSVHRDRAVLLYFHRSCTVWNSVSLPRRF